MGFYQGWKEMFRKIENIWKLPVEVAKVFTHIWPSNLLQKVRID
jgi:hypothetical protein